MEKAAGSRGTGGQQRVRTKGRAHRETAAPALFAFMGSASSSGGLSAWRWVCAPPRFGSGCFRIGQRKPIIRTHPLSEKGSDYMGLVPVVGLEPTRGISPTDFESVTSTNSITPARRRYYTTFLPKAQGVIPPVFPNFPPRPPPDPDLPPSAPSDPPSQAPP